VKTGKLIKFHRPDGDVHAYMYREEGHVRASVFVLSGRSAAREPLARLTGATEEDVERELRAWVDKKFPPGGAAHGP
jgi:YD repeat-containing protein